MKSIKLMFAMTVIGMIAFTSCNSETEQTQESVKTSLTQRPDPGEFVPDEDEAGYIIEDEIAGVNTAEKRAKINCMSIVEGNGGNIPTTATACVTVNGILFNVRYTGEYYQDGMIIPLVCTAIPVPAGFTCNC